ncbi:hypothetical protein Cni_G15854 [Canna indica]|uniref:RING-type domain-containing protein n=1 Tax=Canna indica TaxID=4628 RepID=A0AAQ3KF40_9LILI|nr:hypothetical protein Cni_G15854 [Canna indica]
MGFPSDGHSLILPKPVILFFLFLACIKFGVLVLLYCLGLYMPADPLVAPWQEHAFLFSEEESSAAAAPSAIKKQLRVVEFSSLQARRAEDPTCVICMEEVEAHHKVRELGSCGHGFHVACIDKWVDVGHVNCPLCRASLLPSAEKEGWWWRRLLRAW